MEPHELLDRLGSLINAHGGSQGLQVARYDGDNDSGELLIVTMAGGQRQEWTISSAQVVDFSEEQVDGE